MKKICFTWGLTLTALLMMAAPALAQGNNKVSRSENPVEWARANDASNDRGLLSSHADTLREGEVAINSYELFFFGASYGVTDDFQLSFTTLLPVFSEFPLVGLINGKYVFKRTNRMVLSASANLAFASVDGDGGGLIGASFNFDRYFGKEGTLGTHLAVDLQGAFAGGELSNGALIRFTGGLTIQAGNRVRLLAELMLPTGFVGGEFKSAEFFLLNYGVRFHGDTLAVDLAFIRPVIDGDDGFTDVLPLGLPFVAFSARF